jgi:hypothetical protein
MALNGWYKQKHRRFLTKTKESIMVSIVYYKNERYRVEGNKRVGYTVFKMVNRNLCYVGKSIAETERMAVIDVLRNEYSSYY